MTFPAQIGMISLMRVRSCLLLFLKLSAKEFISAILVLDYNTRPSASECLLAPWLSSNAPSRQLRSLDSFRTGMNKINDQRKK